MCWCRPYVRTPNCGSMACTAAAYKAGQASIQTEMLRAREAAEPLVELVEEVRAIIAEHYPDGTKHDDPSYERRRSVMAALVRQTNELRKVVGIPVWPAPPRPRSA